jgi:hypothetical protein
MKKSHSITAAAALAVAIALAVPSSASAGQITGKINNLHVVGSATAPFVMVNITGAVSGAPACTAWPPLMAVDISTARGKVVMSVLTSAFLAGKTVTLRGTSPGTCVTPANQASGSSVAVEQAYYVLIEQ